MTSGYQKMYIDHVMQASRAPISTSCAAAAAPPYRAESLTGTAPTPTAAAFLEREGLSSAGC